MTRKNLKKKKNFVWPDAQRSERVWRRPLHIVLKFVESADCTVLTVTVGKIPHGDDFSKDTNYMYTHTDDINFYLYFCFLFIKDTLYRMSVFNDAVLTFEIMFFEARFAWLADLDRVPSSFPWPLTFVCNWYYIWILCNCFCCQYCSSII